MAGVYGVSTGSDGIPGTHDADTAVESELRFLYALWIGYGVALLGVVPRVVTATSAVRLLAATLFAAGVARAIAWIDVGRPDTLFVVLMVIELVLPPIIVAAQARLARAS